MSVSIASRKKMSTTDIVTAGNDNPITVGNDNPVTTGGDSAADTECIDLCDAECRRIRECVAEYKQRTPPEQKAEQQPSSDQHVEGVEANPEKPVEGFSVCGVYNKAYTALQQQFLALQSVSCDTLTPTADRVYTLVDKFAALTFTQQKSASDSFLSMLIAYTELVHAVQSDVTARMDLILPTDTFRTLVPWHKSKVAKLKNDIMGLTFSPMQKRFLGLTVHELTDESVQLPLSATTVENENVPARNHSFMKDRYSAYAKTMLSVLHPFACELQADEHTTGTTDMQLSEHIVKQTLTRFAPLCILFLSYTRVNYHGHLIVCSSIDDAVRNFATVFLHTDGSKAASVDSRVPSMSSYGSRQQRQRTRRPARPEQNTYAEPNTAGDGRYHYGNHSLRGGGRPNNRYRPSTGTGARHMPMYLDNSVNSTRAGNADTTSI